jgi:hypothetical protein
MLIYCWNLSLCRSGGVEPLLEAIAGWLVQATGGKVQPHMLRANGQLVDHPRCSLDWLSATGGEQYWLSARLTEPDPKTPGRTWTTEVGICQTPDRFACTVLVRTEEDSPLVDRKVHSTKPPLLDRLRARCRLDGGRCDGSTAPLRLADADRFLSLVNDRSRGYPLVQVSLTSSGMALLDPGRAAAVLWGLAAVSYIPTAENAPELAGLLSERYCCRNGEVNIIWPATVSKAGAVAVPTSRITPDQIERSKANGRQAELELLVTICHQLNRRNARQHVSPEVVRGVANRFALAAARAKGDAAGTKGETDRAELDELYRQVEVDQLERIRALTADLSRAEDQHRAEAERCERLQADNESLKLQLAALAQARAGPVDDRSQPVRARLLALLPNSPTLLDVLETLEVLFPDRIVVLDSARKSAASATNVTYLRKAADLLRRLVVDYYYCKAGGQGDGEARKVFGTEAFAAGESETVEHNARARRLRTFEYLGRPIEMMMHLKIGNKPSRHETFRAHFVWDDRERRILIGHCGPHLDHG